MLGTWVALVLLACVRCHGKSVSRCGSDEFSCKNGFCIHKLQWCDGKVDCLDDTDEDYCNTKSGLAENPNRCDETFFLCNDGRCIPIIGRCDGFASCSDNSDEEGCRTATNETEPSNILSTTPMELETAATFLVTSDPIHFKTEGWVEVDTILEVNDTLKNESYPDNIPEANANSVSLSMKFFGDSSNVNESIATLAHTVPSKDNFIATSSHVLDSSAGLKTSTSSGYALQFEEAVNGVMQNKLSRGFKHNGIAHEFGYKHVVQENSTLYPSANTDQEYTTSRSVLEAVSKILDVSGGSAMAGNFDTHDVVQADTKTSFNITNTMEVSEKGFIELKARDRTLTKALEWLLKSRNADYSWGEETPRAIVAVYMADSMKKQPREEMLMSKQLHLELLSKLIRNDTKHISLVDLSLYINALVASCDNPRNFYGQDLVNILRQRINVAHDTSKVVTPLVYITLCMNNDTTYADVRKIEEIISMFNKADIGALALLAATCASRMQEFSSSRIGDLAAKKLLRRIMDAGLPKNIYELALVSQALNEAQIHQDLWNRSTAMFLITNSQQTDGSFGDVISTYYTVPVLSGRSFLSLGQQCINEGLVPLKVTQSRKDEKIDVHYSLYSGDPVEVSQTLKMKVLKSLNFLDVMRIAATINPVYRFKYDIRNGKPTVYSIGGIVNDAERGLYWTLHLLRQNSTYEDLVPYEGDIRSLIPSLDENIIFWMKSVF